MFGVLSLQEEIIDIRFSLFYSWSVLFELIKTNNPEVREVLEQRFGVATKTQSRVHHNRGFSLDSGPEKLQTTVEHYWAVKLGG